MGEISLASAEWLIAHRQPAETEIADGLAVLEQTLNLNPTLAPALAIKGALYLLSARTSPAGPQRKRAAEQAAHALHQALGKNPLLEHQFGGMLGEATQLSH
jgi:hypothetical protein